MFLSGTTSTLLNSINKQFFVTKVTMAGAIFSVVANIVLISMFSYVGASITSVLTELVVLILMFYALRNTEFKLDVGGKIKPIIQVVMANILMGLVLVYLNLPFLEGVVVSVVVYLILLFVTGAINKEDREIIWSLFNQVRNRG